MLNRRTFLERSGSLLVALGMSGSGLMALSDRYGVALAQATPRKRALLIGINQYAGTDPQGNAWLSPLQGCLTDIELQRELLQYRFGFATGDILTLTDAQATRQAIIEILLTEFIANGQPDDLVAIHFSGYGGQVDLPVQTGGQRSGSRLCSWITADSQSRFSETELVTDLIEPTFTRLIQAIPAQTVIVTLDASHSLEGNSLNPALRSRSRLFANVPEVRPAKITWPPAMNPDIIAPTTLKDSKAIVLWAAQSPDQVGDHAFEAQWAGINAGAFTYALTQQVWAISPARQAYVDFGSVQGHLQQLTVQRQIPQQSGTSKVFPQPLQPEGIDGIVTAVDENRQDISLWIGGIDPSFLDYIDVNTPLQLWPPLSEDYPVYLQVKSRDGLLAKAKLLSADVDFAELQPGQGVREVMRLFRSVGLTIALDANLERVERVDATSALAGIPYISMVVGSNQQADCRLGRVPDQATLALSNSDSPLALQTMASLSLQVGDLPQNHYGLLSPNRVPIAPTLGSQDEAIAGATRRLIPHLRTLLAAKLLRLLVNQPVSQQALQATVTWQREQVTQQTTQATYRGLGSAALIPNESASASSLSIPQGSRFYLQVHNPSPERLYLLLFGLDAVTGQMVYFPTMLSPSEPSQVSMPLTLESNLLRQALLPNQRNHYPTAPTAQAWAVAEKSGQYGLYLIASQAPFTQTWQKLGKQVSAAATLQEMPVPLNNTLAIAQALLEDLDQASLSLTSPTLLRALKDTAIPEQVALHVGAWAGLEFSYVIV